MSFDNPYDPHRQVCTDTGCVRAPWTIPFVPIPAPGGVGLLQFGIGGVGRFVTAFWRFTSVERGIVLQATRLLASPGMAALRRAVAAGVYFKFQFEDMYIAFSEQWAPKGYQAMTDFEARGFTFTPNAFSSESEIVKTILHELWRVTVQSGAKFGSEAGEFTDKAFDFAERAYSAFFH